MKQHGIFKKSLSGILFLALVLSSFGGCSSNTETSPSSSGSSSTPVSIEESDAASSSETGEGGWYDGIDISQPVEITMYVLGTEATDKDKVMEKINERLQAELNSTLNLQIIPLSEYATRYPLILSGGENVDLIYAAPWVNYTENVSRKAFLELTDEFLRTYMPQTMLNEPEEAFKQMTVDGKLYAIPRNQSNYSSYYNIVAVRGELMDKYAFTELTSLDDFEEYLFAVADNESGVYAFYNMPTFNPAIYALSEVNYNFLQIVKGDHFVWKDDGSFSTDEVLYMYETDEYREYVLRMKEWAERGVWPSDAIAGTVSPNDYFYQGRSASNFLTPESVDASTTSCATYGITDVEYYDIFPDSTARKSDYSGDAIAIPYVSKSPERAAMVLDMLKNDHELNLLFVGGIEGEHYIYDAENNTHTDGPSAANYTWDGFGWAIRNDWNPTLPVSDTAKALQEAAAERTLGDYWPCSGFSFNQDSVRSQLTIIDSLITEYSTSFDLGVFTSDTEAKLDEFIGRVQEAGLEEVKTEYLSQLSSYVGE